MPRGPKHREPVESSVGDLPRDGELDLGSVGSRLRRLRQLRRLTLQEVADGVDLSPSFLSMVERGEADISLSRFTRLCEFYAIRPNELLLGDDSRVRPLLVSANDGLSIDRGPGVTYRLLLDRHSGGQVIHVGFEPYAGFRDLLAHNGEDTCWVVRGDLTLLYGDAEYAVPTGHCISYPGSVPHAFRNDRGKPAEMIGFVSPPYW